MASLPVAIIAAGSAFVIAAPAKAVPIQELPGLLSITVCLGGGPSHCSTLNRENFAAAPDSLLLFNGLGISPPGGTIHGGLSDATGVLNQGDEFLLLFFQTDGVSFDSIELNFDAAPGVTKEGPAGITFESLVFNGDLMNALGPRDQITVGIASGPIVFGFASVPEPSTLLLLASGLAAMAVGRKRGGL